MGSLTPTIKTGDSAELWPKRKKGTTSFPEAQLTSKSCETPSICCIFCLPAVGAASFPAGARQGVGSSAPARAHLPWHRLTCVSLSTQPYFPFLALTVLLLVSVFWHFPLSEAISSLPAHPIQAGAGWSWEEAAVRTIQCDFRLNVSCPVLVIIAGIRAH